MEKEGPLPDGWEKVLCMCMYMCMQVCMYMYVYVYVCVYEPGSYSMLYLIHYSRQSNQNDQINIFFNVGILYVCLLGYHGGRHSILLSQVHSVVTVSAKNTGICGFSCTSLSYRCIVTLLLLLLLSHCYCNCYCHIAIVIVVTVSLLLRCYCCCYIVLVILLLLHCNCRWDRPDEQVATALESRIAEEKRRVDEAVEVGPGAVLFQSSVSR